MRRLLILALAACVAVPAQAQMQSESVLRSDASEEERKQQAAVNELFNFINPVVTTATKDSRRAESAPSIITVLTRQDMRNWGYDTLAEAISHMVGFYMVDDHVLPNVAVRGVSGGYRAESSVIKVLMNGSPVSFRSTNGNWLGAQLIPLTAVERVEILRGPASALYGADAFLGVINIITRDPSKDMAEVWVAGNWRQGNSTVGYDQDMSVNLRRGRLKGFLGVRLEAEDRSGMGLPNTPPAPNFPSYALSRNTSGGDLVPSRSGIVRLQYEISKDTKVALSGYLAYMERIDEWAGLEQLADGTDPQGRTSRNLTANLQGFANAQLTSKLSDTLDLNVLFTYFLGRPRQFNRTEVNSNFYYVRRDFGFNGLDASAEVRWELLPKTLAITGGLELIYDLERLPSNLGIAKLNIIGTAPGGVISGFTTIQGNKAIFNPAAYVQALWTVDERWLTVAGGLRYDYHTIYAGQPSGRLGLVSEPFRKFYLKALYGSAFKAPSPLLLYAVPARANDITGNAALLPQRVNTFEFEATRIFLDFISVSTGVAYSLLDNQAEFTQSGAYQIAVNTASVRSLSWETRARLVRPDDIEAYATFELNYTLRNTTDIGYKQALVGDRNAGYPFIQAHAGVIKWLPKYHVRGMIDATYAAPRNATVANTLLNGGTYQLPQYVDIGAGIASVGLKLLGDHPFTVGVMARNLLGENAGESGYLGVDYPRLPRSVYFYLNQEI